MKWISIKTALPLSDTLVLVYKPDMTSPTQWAVVVYLDIPTTFNDDNEHFNQHPGSFCSVEKPGMVLLGVTHWAVLEAPSDG